MSVNAERITKLASILRSYAPTEIEKKLVDNFTSTHQTTDAERILELTSAIYNGLAYGNWPWILVKMNKK